MKKLLLLAAASLFACVQAEPVGTNGDFEKCKADGSGTLLPEGWILNKGVSKNAVVQMSNEKDDVHGGAFAMSVETEKDGQAFLMCWTPVNVAPGDSLKFGIYARGTGSFSFGYILNGKPEGASESTFLWTAGGKKFSANEDEYLLFEETLPIKEAVKDGKKCSDLSIIPVLIVGGDSEIMLDDYTAEAVRPTAKE